MAPVTPYTPDLAGRDPMAAMRDSSERLRLLSSWTPQQFERTYAPGKWTARQIVVHLAQTELALGTRARLALSTPNYVAQPFDQDAWIDRETRLSGPDAVSAFLAISRMNVALFDSLSPKERDTPFSHPEYGTISVDWIVHQMAGHHIHHLAQIQKISARSGT